MANENVTTMKADAKADAEKTEADDHPDYGAFL